MNPPPPPSTEHVEKVRSGQRMILLAVLLNIGSIPLRVGTDNQILLIISGIVALIAIVVSIIGILRMSSGLGYHIAVRILCCIVMFIPLINLLVLLFLNSKATKTLREHDYKVGLLGAKIKNA